MSWTFIRCITNGRQNEANKLKVSSIQPVKFIAYTRPGTVLRVWGKVASETNGKHPVLTDSSEEYDIIPVNKVLLRKHGEK